MTADLPDVIRRYQDAHDQRATEAALATFAPEARVVDDGREHIGTDAVRRWLATEGSQFTFTRTLLESSDEGDGSWLLVNRLDGDFPGGRVDLRYRFRIVDDRIAELLVAP